MINDIRIEYYRGTTSFHLKRKTNKMNNDLNLITEIENEIRIEYYRGTTSFYLYNGKVLNDEYKNRSIKIYIGTEYELKNNKKAVIKILKEYRFNNNIMIELILGLLSKDNIKLKEINEILNDYIKNKNK